MENQKHLDQISEIKKMMERSSRFISLSGLSGVFAGIWAIGGAMAAYIYFEMNILKPSFYESFEYTRASRNVDDVLFFITDALIVLVLTFATGIYFTTRKAKKDGVAVWGKMSRKLLVNLFIPIVTGGVFCLLLYYHGEVLLIAPAMLIFYGLSLINASPFTLPDIRYLGMTEVVLGLISAYFVGYGLLFWTIGFGILHIIYGMGMYFKYER